MCALFYFFISRIHLKQNQIHVNRDVVSFGAKLKLFIAPLQFGVVGVVVVATAAGLLLLDFS